MGTILISICPFDIPLRYGYHYLKRFATFAARKRHRVILLKTATLKNFGEALNKYDPDFVIVGGHGGSKGVTGCDFHVILGIKSWDQELNVKIIRQNPEWMRGRIVYLFTCNAGKELAPSLISYGARAVAAFQDAYIFLAENGGDHEAYPFFASALQLPILLAAGFTFEEGCQAVRNSFIEYRDKAEVRGDTLEAKYLHFDFVNFVSLGDLGARL